MPIIRTITGSESFREGSSSFIVAVMPTRETPMPSPKGLFISEAAKTGRYVSQTSKPAYQPASMTGLKDQGFFWDGTYTAPDGLVLRLYARRNTRFNGRPDVKQGVVFIRIREQGPLNRIELQRIDAAQSTNAPAYVEGRFDVITVKEAVQAGVPMEAADMTISRAEAVRHVLAKTEVAPARVAPTKARVETVTGHDGEEVRVVSTRQKRAINLG